MLILQYERRKRNSNNGSEDIMGNANQRAGLVTGASTDIGNAMSARLAAPGYARAQAATVDVGAVPFVPGRIGFADR